jgi:hypothetical protein
MENFWRHWTPLILDLGDDAVGGLFHVAGTLPPGEERTVYV